MSAITPLVVPAGMSVTDAYNARVLAIWNDAEKPPTYMPSLYPDEHLDGPIKLLMLGMNPSFGRWLDTAVEELFSADRLGELGAEQLYAWRDDYTDRDIARVKAVEAYAFTAYRSFFGPLRDFAMNVGCGHDYRHLDLFQVRKTDQSAFLSTVGKPTGKGNFQPEPFGRAQIELTRQTLLTLKPAVVVIANAAASRIATQHFPLCPIANVRTQFTMCGLPETRFFLSGMLSGGALDEYSRHRLEDEVRRYLQHA